MLDLGYYEKVALVLLALTIIVTMLSFMKSLLGSNGEVVTPETVAEHSDSDVQVPYKMDVTGADKIVVTRTDHDVEGRPRQTKEITDQETIKRIIELLREIPKDGAMMKSMVPHMIHGVVAYKDGQPFAMISFSRKSLRTDSTGFNVGDDAVAAKEAELFSLIEIK